MGQFQGQEDVVLVIAADDVDRDLPDRARLAAAGVVPEHVEVPALGLLDVIRVVQVETLDTDTVGEAECLDFGAKRRYIGETSQVAMIW